MKILSAIVAVFLTLPIWLFLQYKILVLVNATELMWFLFWVYVPAAIFVGVTQKLLEKK